MNQLDLFAPRTPEQQILRDLRSAGGRMMFSELVVTGALTAPDLAGWIIARHELTKRMIRQGKLRWVGICVERT